VCVCKYRRTRVPPRPVATPLHHPHTVSVESETGICRGSISVGRAAAPGSASAGLVVISISSAYISSVRLATAVTAKCSVRLATATAECSDSSSRKRGRYHVRRIKGNGIGVVCAVRGVCIHGRGKPALWCGFQIRGGRAGRGIESLSGRF
jgi:hypothetical protein